MLSSDHLFDSGLYLVADTATVRFTATPSIGYALDKARIRYYPTDIDDSSNSASNNCNLTITADGVSSKCDIDASFKTAPAIDSLTLPATENMIFTRTNTDKRLTVTIVPDDIPVRLKWESSNPDVATVSGIGKTITVIAKGFGTTTITATALDDDTKFASCVFTVLEPPQLSVSIANIANLDYTVNPGKTYDVNVYIDSNGVDIAELTAYLTFDDSVMTLVQGSLESGNAMADYTFVGNEEYANDKIQAKFTKATNSHPKPNDVMFKAKFQIKDNAAIGQHFLRLTCNTNDVKDAAGNIIPVTKIDHSFSVYCPVESITFSKDELTIAGNRGEAITVTVSPEGSNPKLNWTSTDLVVAQYIDGQIYGNAPGTTTITATSASDPTKFYSCDVTVEQVDLTNFIMLIDSFEQFSDTFTLTLSPSDYTGKQESNYPHFANLIWFPYPENATISQFNIVRPNSEIVTYKIENNNITLWGEKEGTSEISFRGFNFNSLEPIERTCNIVVKYPVDSISMDAAKTLDMSSKTDIAGWTPSVTFDPVKATYKGLEWSVVGENDGVISIDSSGKVVPLKDGTVTIKATAVDNPSATATCAVTVRVGVTGVSIPYASSEVYMGSNTTISASVSPDNATDKSVTWSSSDESIATVDEDGIVTAVKPGTVTITVTTADGELTDSCELTVKQYPTGVSITGVPYLEMDSTTQLTAMVTPEYAADKSVTWEVTSGDDIVSIDQTGKVTSNDKLGTATIKVTSAADTDVYNSITVKVLERGDANLDGNITLYDTAFIMRYKSGLVPDMSADKLWEADADRDGEVTMSDALQIMRYMNELSSSIDSAGGASAAEQLVSSSALAPMSLSKLQSRDVNPVVSIGDIAKANPGDEITVTVSLASNSVGFATALLELEYDSTAMEVVPGSLVNKLSGYTFVGNEEYSSDTVSASYAAATNTAANGEMFEVTFKIKDDATYGTKAFTLTLPASDRRDEENAEVTFTANAGNVLVDTGTRMVTGISFTFPLQYIAIGGTLDLKPTLTVTPSDASNTGVTWASSNKDIATVDENGIVTAQGGDMQQVMITATAKDGSGISKDVEVRIKSGLISISIYDKGTGDEVTNFDMLSNMEDTRRLGVRFYPSTASGTVAWESYNTSVATVDSDGTVTAQTAGQTTIIAKVGDITDSCDVNVKELIYPTSVSIDNANVFKKIKLGTKDIPIKLKYEPADSDTSYTRKDPSITDVLCDDANVATIGTAPGFDTLNTQGLGTAKLALRYNTANGEKYAYYDFTVYKGVDGITVSPATLKMYIDGENSSATLQANIQPSDAEYKSVSWDGGFTDTVTYVDIDASSNNAAPTLTAVSPGTTTILARPVDDSSLSAACEVTVYAKPTSITMSKSTLTLDKIVPHTLIATVLPAEDTDSGVTWSSDDTNVATVDQNGVVTGKNIGTTTIRATANGYSDIVGVCDVTIVPVVQEVTGVELSSDTLQMYKNGLTRTLTPSVFPTDASNKSVTWSLTSGDCVTVDQNGVVSPVADTTGTATITVTTVDGQFTDTCTVTVSNETVDSVSIIPDKLTLDPGSYQTLSVQILPETIEDKRVIWESANTDIATVDQNGCVTVLTRGVTTIKATSVADSDKFGVSTIVMLGDVSLDGKVTIPDAILILRYKAGLTTLDETQLWAADIDGNGNVTIPDAIRILRFKAGLDAVLG